MRAWAILVALAASTFLYVTIETLPIGLLPQIAGGLGVGESAVGLLVTAYGLVVVIGTFPLTRLTHRWPRRRLLTALLLVATAATTLSALAPSYPVLLTGRIAAALSQAVFWAVVTPAAASLFPVAARGRAIAILYAGSSAGPLLGVPTGTWLGQQSGWRVPFLALAALGLAISAVIVTLMPTVPPGAGHADRGTAPSPRRYRVLVVSTALIVTGAFTAFTCVTPFLTEVTNLPAAAVGPALLLRGLAGLLGAIAAGFIAEHRAWRAMVAISAVQSLALAAAATLGTNAAASVVATALAGAALSALTTVLGTRVLQVAPGSTDLASAGTSTAFNVGITAGALTGSFLLDAGALRESAALGAVIAAVGLAVVAAEPWFAARRRIATGACAPQP